MTTTTPTSRKQYRNMNRKQKRLLARKKRNRLLAIAASVAVALPVAGFGIYEIVKPVSALDAARMFPEKTNDLRTFTPESIEEIPNAEVLKKLQNYGAGKNGKDDPATPQSPYFDSFMVKANAFTTFRQNNDWMGTSFAEGKWDGGASTIYAVRNNGDAEKFMLSEECKKSFFAENCGEGNFVLKNRWLVTGDKNSLALYSENFETSLADNPKFAVQTEGVLNGTFAAAWTPSENITSFLPLGLNKALPSKAQAAVALIPTSKGVTVSGSIFKGESENPLFTKAPISDSITQTPENTVMAISVSQAYQDVQRMTEDPQSFINTEEEWTGLRKGLEGYGVSVPKDLKTVFGETTTFSLNEGTIGNKVAGTLRIDKGDSEKAKSILGKAAEDNENIKEMYTLKQSGDRLLIESHSPVTEGSVANNPLFSKLVGGMENSVAVAFIDFDAARSLLDSNYIKPEASYDKGVMGINIFKKNAGEFGVAINWDMLR